MTELINMDKCALRRIEVNIAETKGREKVVAPSSWINVSDWNVQPTTAQVRLFSDGSAENQSNLVTRGGQVFRTSPWQRFLSVILEVEKMLSCIGFKNYIFQFVCAWVKSRERIIHNVSSSQRQKLALARPFLFSRAWFSGRRESMGSEMLLFCDQDWKDRLRNVSCLDWQK